MRKRALLAAVVATVMAACAAGTAFAGESTGNYGSTTSQGKNNTQTPIGLASETDPHAQSICSFSGQNPEAFLPVTDPNYEPGRTQSWGQIPKAIRDAMPAFLQPGESCNGHTGFFAQGGTA